VQHNDNHNKSKRKEKEKEMSKAENILENLPSNQQIEKGIDTVKKEIHAVRTAPGIDVTGHKILTDTEQVLTSAERLIREKNEGDKVQEIIREGQKASTELQKHALAMKEAGMPTIDTEGLRDLAEKTLETARLAGMELISSNSFRRSLSDFLLLCYDILADTAIDTGVAGKKIRRKRKGKKKKVLPAEAPKALEEPAAVAPKVSEPPVKEPSEAGPSVTGTPAEPDSLKIKRRKDWKEQSIRDWRLPVHRRGFDCRRNRSIASWIASSR
jgi:hypothetical protein